TTFLSMSRSNLTLSGFAPFPAPHWPHFGNITPRLFEQFPSLAVRVEHRSIHPNMQLPPHHPAFRWRLGWRDRIRFPAAHNQGCSEEVTMDFRYQSLEWQFPAEPSTTTQQSLDDLINEKCRIGWALHGMYAESADGSKYRLLFRIPCPERVALARFAREAKEEFGAERKCAAEGLLEDLLGLNGVWGLTVAKSEEGELIVRHRLGTKDAAVYV